MDRITERAGGRRQRHKEHAFYFIHEPVIYVPILLGAVFAWFAPVDVLDQSALLRRFVEWVGSIYRPLGRYASKSSFPQVTAVYFAAMFVHAPLHMFFVGRYYRSTLPDRRGKVTASPARIWLCFLVLCPVAIIYFLHWDPGRALAITPVHDSRLALGLVGWLYAGGLGFILLGALFHSIDEHWNGKLKDKEET